MKKQKKPTQTGVTIDKVCAITLLDRALIVKLGRLGYFPKPKDGLFDLGETIKGCFKYLSEERSKKGRPENGTQELPIYNSMTNCFAAAGVPIDVQKKAKSEGCTAFRFARVSLGPLLKHIFSFEAIGKVDAKQVGSRTRLDDFRAGREEIKFKKEAQLVVDKTEVRSGLQQALGEMFGVLDRVFLSELPAAIVGLKEVEIRARHRQEIGLVKTALKERFDQIAAEEKKAET